MEERRYVNMCRTCLMTGSNVTLFSVYTLVKMQDDSNMAINDMLMDCASLQIVYNDPLPKKICSVCMLLAKQSYLFKEKCQKSEQYLINCMKVKQETPESQPIVINDYLDITSLSDGNPLETCKNAQQLTTELIIKSETDCNSDTRDYESRNIENRITCINVCNDVYAKNSHIKRNENEEINKKLYKGSSSNSTNRNDNGTEDRVTTELFECKECKMMFRNKSTLKRHMAIHFKSRPYKCDECEKAFIKKKHLIVHMNIHTKIRSFKCDQCDKTFIRKCGLDLHARVHTQSRPYKCDRCERAFNHKSTLDLHQRVHTQNRPYKCNQCEKAFIQKYSLNNHLRIHSQVRPYICNLCKKSFHTKGNLRIHMLTHSEERKYECDQCEKKFKRKYLLKIHTRIHTQCKPYKCDQCEKTFSTNSHLTLHVQTHAQESPYKCDICKKSYYYKSSLKAHYLQIHGQKETQEYDQTIQIFNYENNSEILDTPKKLPNYKSDDDSLGRELKKVNQETVYIKEENVIFFKDESYNTSS